MCWFAMRRDALLFALLGWRLASTTIRARGCSLGGLGIKMLIQSVVNSGLCCTCKVRLKGFSDKAQISTIYWEVAVIIEGTFACVQLVPLVLLHRDRGYSHKHVHRRRRPYLERPRERWEGLCRHVRHRLTNMHLDHLREWEVFAASR